MAGQISHIYDLIRAFPTHLAGHIHHVLDIIPTDSHLSYSDSEELTLAGETLLIPYRIYAEPDDSQMSSLTDDQKIILQTLYTRHHNGYVREKNLRQVITHAADHAWITPFLMILIGEYIMEILQFIHDNRSVLNPDFIRSFIRENPTFYRMLQSRVMSYWNCYYRRQYPTRDNYVGFQLLNYIDQMLR